MPFKIILRPCQYLFPFHGFGIKQFNEINCLKPPTAKKINMKIIRNIKSVIKYVKYNFESSFHIFFKKTFLREGEGYKVEKEKFSIHKVWLKGPNLTRNAMIFYTHSGKIFPLLLCILQ